MTSAAAARPSRASWAWPALILGAVAAAYATAMRAGFVLDDHEHVVANPAIRALWPPLWLASDRPLVHLTLAVNHALGGLDPRGYHAFNVLVHLSAALVLFAVLARTFGGPRLRERLGADAVAIAGAGALVWAVHPLLTQAVTYVVQRGESMAGLLALLALYGVIRGASSARAARWWVVAVLACAVGMTAKPVMVVAPVLILLYDRVFLAPSWREVLARRVLVHGALFATIGVAAWLAISVPNPTAGFGIPITWWEYFRTQPGVVLHYLRLVLWPAPLVFDYGWPVARGLAATALPALPLALALAATAWGLLRAAPLAYLGAWFFLALAPSSSVLPIKDLAFEHRMYLAAVAPVTALVLLAHALLRRLASSPGARRIAGAALLIAIVVPLAFATARRNLDYRDEVTLWTDVVAKRPQNSRAHYALGGAYLMAGDAARAAPHLRGALRRQPDNVVALNNLAAVELDAGRAASAESLLVRAIAVRPDFARAHHNLGRARLMLGRPREAAVSHEEALRLAPGDPEAAAALAAALAVTPYFEAIDAVPAALGPDYREIAVAHENSNAVVRVFARVDGTGREIARLSVHLELEGATARVRLETLGPVPEATVQAASRAIATALR